MGGEKMNKEKAISRLRNMLKWSDRIGSDEVYEIVCIMNLLEGKKRFNEESIIKQWSKR
tara:strand:- start:2 stop:178 length:177 start_codon:yes stop_codon:yes gene_type:complete